MKVLRGKYCIGLRKWWYVQYPYKPVLLFSVASYQIQKCNLCFPRPVFALPRVAPGRAAKFEDNLGTLLKQVTEVVPQMLLSDDKPPCAAK